MTTEPIIFIKGDKFTVEFAIEANGKSGVYTFMDGLDLGLKVKISSVIKRFADFGNISNTQQFKKVEGNFWEFKHYQTRIIMYHCGPGCIALTNGFIKKSDKTPKSEIERAKRIKREYEQIREEMRHEQ